MNGYLGFTDYTISGPSILYDLKKHKTYFDKGIYQILCGKGHYLTAFAVKSFKYQNKEGSAKETQLDNIGTGKESVGTAS